MNRLSLRCIQSDQHTANFVKLILTPLQTQLALKEKDCTLMDDLKKIKLKPLIIIFLNHCKLIINHYKKDTFLMHT